MKRPKKINSKGFTLVELIVVIGVFSIIFSSSTLVFGNMIQRNGLRYNGYQLIQSLREARTSSLIQKNDSSWGVRFDQVTIPNGYTFFKGSSYATRDVSFDRDFEFPQVIVIDQISLGGSSEVVFNQADGEASSFGTVALTANNENYSISINELGFVDYVF